MEKACCDIEDSKALTPAESQQEVASEVIVATDTEHEADSRCSPVSSLIISSLRAVDEQTEYEVAVGPVTGRCMQG